MSASLPGGRELPASQHDLSTYWGRVRHIMGLTDPSTLLVGSTGLEQAKSLLTDYKQGKIPFMTPDLWKAKKVVDSTLHPDTGEPVLLPFRMSAYVLTNLVVTVGMLQPGLGTAGTIAWQVINQSLNVAINSANANKSSPLSWRKLGESYAMAVSVSCGVAVGLNKLVPRLRNLTPATRTTLTRLVPFAAVASAGFLNVLLMRSEEMRTGIDIFPVISDAERARKEKEEGDGAGQPQSLGRSKKAAQIAVGETAASRVFNSTPVMAITPLVLVRLQQQQWLKQRPRLTVPVNIGLILVTSYAVLPWALAVFPQRQTISADKLEPEFHGRGLVVFNRGL
ncbi:putative mitochondrial transport protein fsf1 [Colletotrichum tanaceti]|nr:putative mitochondrial transport protein fsf1 [Colletotrichum tanaceti]